MLVLKARHLIIPLLVATTLPVPAQARVPPSFPCHWEMTKGESRLTRDERLICESDALAHLDSAIALHYRDLTGHLVKDGLAKLRGDQRAWLKVRAECGKRSGDVEARQCIQDASVSRLKELQALAKAHGLVPYYVADYSALHDIPVPGVKNFGGGYKSDGKTVFYQDKAIPEADAGSFAAYSERRHQLPDQYMKDARHVYLDGKALPGADPKTFVNLGPTDCGPEARYCQPPLPLDCAHPASSSERLICGSPELMVKARELNEAIGKQKEAAVKRYLFALQNDWRAERERCDAAACILSAFNTQLGYAKQLSAEICSAVERGEKLEQLALSETFTLEEAKRPAAGAVSKAVQGTLVDLGLEGKKEILFGAGIGLADPGTKKILWENKRTLEPYISDGERATDPEFVALHGFTYAIATNQQGDKHVWLLHPRLGTLMFCKLTHREQITLSAEDEKKEICRLAQAGKLKGLDYRNELPPELLVPNGSYEFVPGVAKAALFGKDQYLVARGVYRYSPPHGWDPDCNWRSPVIWKAGKSADPASANGLHDCDNEGEIVGYKGKFYILKTSLSYDPESTAPKTMVGLTEIPADMNELGKSICRFDRKNLYHPQALDTVPW